MKIHTFEVSAMLTNESYYLIQSELKAKDKDKWKTIKNGMQYWGLSHKGILISMYQVKKKGFYTYYINYRISAQRVIENDNFVGLFNIKKYDELEEKVNSILKEQCMHLRCINYTTNVCIDFFTFVHLQNTVIQTLDCTPKKNMVISRIINVFITFVMHLMIM